MLTPILHLLGVANFAYAIYYEFYHINIPQEVSKTRHLYGGPWKYLTFINLWIQLFYFFIALLNHFVGTEAKTKPQSSLLQTFRDGLFATLAFPIGIFVGTIFWGLYAINRNLIFPTILDMYIPTYVNHMLHTTVIPIQIWELVRTFHVYPSRRKGMAVTGLFCFGYLVWICCIACFGGFWVYPIFKKLTPEQRAAFMLGCAVLGGVLYVLGEFLNSCIWAQTIQKSKMKAKAR